MKMEQLVRFHVVLGKGPLERLLVLFGEVSEQIGRTLEFEALSSHLNDFELLTFSIRIGRVSDQVKANVVSYTKSTCRLGCDGGSIIL